MNLTGVSLVQKDSLQRGALAVGVIALALSILSAFFNPQQFFHSYLLAYLYWIGLPLGCLAIVMLHHLVGGTWGFVIQRLLESGIRTFPLMALLFLPLLFGMSQLYPWARPETVAADPILQQKSLYLNVPFFVARAVVYFAIWISVGHFLSRWSLEQDRTADSSLTVRLQNLSGPGLVLYGLTVTFSVIDWIMSLEPRWYSTIYGMIFIVSYGLAALSFVIGAAFLLAGEKPLAQVIAPSHFHDLGNLLLALVMFWAYMAFSQFLLVWVENLRDEIPWYLHRTAGGWQVIALALILFQFTLPFVFLLSRITKRSAGLLSMVALVILFMHWVDLFWFVAPAFHPERLYIHWLDVVISAGIGGIWLSAFLSDLKQRSLLPLHDSRFANVLEQGKES
jgi:hypothetical protein